MMELQSPLQSPALIRNDSPSLDATRFQFKNLLSPAIDNNLCSLTTVKLKDTATNQLNNLKKFNFEVESLKNTDFHLSNIKPSDIEIESAPVSVSLVGSKRPSKTQEEFCFEPSPLKQIKMKNNKGDEDDDSDDDDSENKSDNSKVIVNDKSSNSPLEKLITDLDSTQSSKSRRISLSSLTSARHSSGTGTISNTSYSFGSPYSASGINPFISPSTLLNVQQEKIDDLNHHTKDLNVPAQFLKSNSSSSLKILETTIERKDRRQSLDNFFNHAQNVNYLNTNFVNNANNNTYTKKKIGLSIADRRNIKISSLSSNKMMLCGKNPEVTDGDKYKSEIHPEMHHKQIKASNFNSNSKTGNSHFSEMKNETSSKSQKNIPPNLHLANPQIKSQFTPDSVKKLDLITPKKEGAIFGFIEAMYDEFYDTDNFNRNSEDPRKWSINKVQKWAKWIEKSFNISSKKFINEKLSGDEVHRFFERSDGSDRFRELWGTSSMTPYDHWRYLVRNCPQKLEHNSSSKFITNLESSSTHSLFYQNPQQKSINHGPPSTFLQPQSQPSHQSISSEILSNMSIEEKLASSLQNATGGGPIQLWHFLLELLLDPNRKKLIGWTGNGWEFKIIEPDDVAVLWGQRKNKSRMNYEKLSRGLLGVDDFFVLMQDPKTFIKVTTYFHPPFPCYYYDKEILEKTPSKRYVYKFVCDMNQILKIEPEQVHAKYGIVTNREDDRVSKHNKIPVPKHVGSEMGVIAYLNH